VLFMVGISLVLAPTATARSAAIAIDSRSPALERVEAGGWTTTLGFTNLTQTPLTLIVKPNSMASAVCKLALDKTELADAEHAAIKVTVPEVCNAGKQGFDFEVLVGGPTGQVASFVVDAILKPAPGSPEWSALWAFPIALAGLLALVICVFIFGPNEAKPKKSLEYLSATWSFKDSWVTNVTLAGGLLTGLFGSTEVVTDILGQDAKSSVALAIVGAAFAVVFVGAGAIILAATKSRKGFFTVGGLLVAGATTLAGALGQIWVTYRSGTQLELGGWQHRIIILAIVATLLLLFYACRTLPATIRQGLTKPPPPPPSDAMTAAAIIVAGLRTEENISATAFQSTVDAVGDNLPITTMLAPEPTAPEVSALL
jgi:hypothetical protein